MIIQETSPAQDPLSLLPFLDRFPNARILVLGDIILDTYVWGRVARISPEAPVPVVEVESDSQRLGGAANVIHNLATLGASPILCGVVGSDQAGKQVRQRIADLHLMDAGVLVEPERPTSKKTRIIAHQQQIVRVDRETRAPLRPESVRKILAFVEQNLQTLDGIIVSDYGKGVVSTPVMQGLRALTDRGPRRVLITVDPKTGNFEYYKGVDSLTPNHHEAGVYCGFEILDEEDLLRAGRKMLSDLAARSVLITRGKDGMTLFERTGEILHIPTLARKVFDVTGAGDTVIGTLSLGLAVGMDLKTAAVLSNTAAGIVVGEVGTSAVRLEDLKRVLTETRPKPYPPGHGISHEPSP